MKPVRVYELLARRSDGLPPETLSALEIFAEGLEQYRRQRWTAAMDLFEKVLAKKSGDGPAAEFIRRCQIFMEHPRPADWDGVFELRSK